ncbi:MAG: XRE family transcriptional regulator [Candidatus Stahlbacteria bacterium]|nr:MAG: XRE family transcriptional regulator [Candidatus Stahlbacteria bacterium]
MNVDDDALIKRIGVEIRSRRRALGWSQEKLAEEADLNPRYVSKLERFLSNPSATTLFRIAIALKVSPNDLLDFSPSGETSHDPRILSEKLFQLLKGKPKLQVELLKRLLDETARLLK